MSSACRDDNKKTVSVFWVREMLLLSVFYYNHDHGITILLVVFGWQVAKSRQLAYVHSC